MEARRRHVGSAYNRPSDSYIVYDDVNDSGDECDCEPITLDILKVYDDSDEDDNANTNKRRRYYQQDKVSRKPITDTAMYMLLFAFLVVSLFIVNLRSNRELNKIKSNMGYEEKKPHPLMWWNSAVIYYLQPIYFQDSDDDGIGDIRGIFGHLDHLEFLKVEAVLLSSIFPSADLVNGGGVTNFTDIDPLLGNLKTFQTLVKQLHQRGIKLILDFPLNHSGDKHPWFQASVTGGVGNIYRDFYVWHPGNMDAEGRRVPPNNWLSRCGGSAWSWEDTRQEFYLHQVCSGLPDLNHRNPKLRDELIAAFQFWTEQGVDGFSLRDVNLLFEVDDLEMDEPESDIEGVKPDEYAYLEHVYTDDQPEIHEYMATWREFIDGHHQAKDKRLFLTVEVEDDNMGDVRKYYDTGVDAPLNPFMSTLAGDCNGHCIHQLLDSWTIDVPDGRSTVWLLSSSSEGRISTRIEEIYIKAMVVVQYTLPGSAVIHQGDEIGMSPPELSSNEQPDYDSAPFQSHPMPWDDTRHSGFTQAKEIYNQLKPSAVQHVQAQRADPNSLLHIHHRLAALRSEDVMREGGMKYIFTNDKIFSFVRYSRQYLPYLVVVNVGKGPSTEDFSLMVGMSHGYVAFYTMGTPEERAVVYTEGERVELYSITLYPGDAIILKLA